MQKLVRPTTIPPSTSACTGAGRVRVLGVPGTTAYPTATRPAISPHGGPSGHGAALGDPRGRLRGQGMERGARTPRETTEVVK